MNCKPIRPLAVLAAVALTACGGSDAPASSAGGQGFVLARVRAIHASADAPNVNVVGSQGILFGDLEFKESTTFGLIGVGPSNVRVDGQLPGGLATVVPPRTLTFGTSDEYTLIVAGPAAALSTILIEEPATRVAANSVRARVVHAAPRAPAVDVYVTAPTASLAQSPPLGRVAFGERIEPATVPAGDYRIRVTAASDPNAIVFDSGSVTLPSAANLLVLAVDNTGTGTAPISLLVVAETSRFEIFDAAAPAELRAVHVSPDAPPVDVVLDGNFAQPVLEDVPYAAVSGYLALPPGAHNLKVTAANNPGAIVIDTDVTLAAGTRYSLLATGPLAAIAPQLVIDDGRGVATAAKLRVLHAAPSAAPVDVYVTARGAGIATAVPAARGVAFRADTRYLALAGGAYDLTVAPAGAKTAALGPLAITIVDGGVYGAIVSDAVGGGTPLGAILLDGLVP